MNAIDLETPAVTIDLDALERNLRRMQERSRSRMNEEHGVVPVGRPARVGEKLWVVPGHAGTCVNLHDEIAYGRGGGVEGKWAVAARERVR